MDRDGQELRELISKAYPADRRRFHTIPSEEKNTFSEKWEQLHDGIREAARPLKMGKLWMTGAQMVGMLNRIEMELRTHGKVSLPSLHRHVILDSWLKPTVSQVLSSRMDKLLEEFTEEELATHKVGEVQGKCAECGQEGIGW